MTQGAPAARMPALHGVPKIGVALSSGGPAAMAQIGVVEELVAAGIRIDAVAGASAGALVGAAVAAGDLAGLRDTVCRLDRRRVVRLFDLTWPRSGLLGGRRAMNLIEPHVGTRIETLRLPYAAVAADLRSGAEVVLRCGPVIDAIRASIAIPGIFTPQVVDGTVLVDGGLVNPLPVSVARALGATFVIAVCVFPLSDGREPVCWEAGPTNGNGDGRDTTARFLDAMRNQSLGRAVAQENGSGADATGIRLLQVLWRSIQVVELRIARGRLHVEPPDFLITVPAPEIGLFDFHRSAEMIAAGRDAAHRALPALRSAVAERLGVWPAMEARQG